MKMTIEFPKSLRNILPQGIYILAMVGFFLLFAILYEPRFLVQLLSTGDDFYTNRDMSAFNLAISCAIVSVSMLLLRLFFLLFKNSITTSIGKYSAWCVFEVLVTAAFLALYFVLIAKPTTQAGTYFMYWGICIKAYLCIVIFPYIIILLSFINHDLVMREPLQDDSRVRFYDNRHLLRFATTVSSILYIAAEENYIVVYYLENGIPKKTQIRSTMKSLEPMCETGNLVRVHRSYIVNPKHVKNIRKDPDGFFFADLDTETDTVPVSKRYQKSLDAIL